MRGSSPTSSKPSAKNCSPPESDRVLRTFSSGEVARLLSNPTAISAAFFKPQATLPNHKCLRPSILHARTGQRTQDSLFRTQPKPKDALGFLPRRRPAERLRTLSWCVNFKGGSAKTTTTLYLPQYLAMRGYRVLALDLDPQASLTSMFGLQPEFDSGDGDTLFGAIRYDENSRRSLKGISSARPISAEST